MKIGFCMLLWTTSVTAEHRRLLEDIRATGYDGVEIPIFGGTPDDYARIGRMLDEIGLGRTGISVMPPEADALSADPALRKAAVARLAWTGDCAAALGATCVGGPLHQVLGQFSGGGPTEAEFERMREVHRAAGDAAARKGVGFALEAVNRFESYFANTMDDLSAYVDLGRPSGDLGDVRHLPRQHRGGRPGGEPSRATPHRSPTSTFPRTIAACRAAATCRGRRRSAR